MTSGRRWLWFSLAAVATLVVLFLLFASVVPLRSETLRHKIVETLSNRLNSDVALDDLSLRLFPRLRATGSGLQVRQRDRVAVPPLIAIRSFTVDTDLLGAWRKRVAHVELEGLDISIPPNRDDDRSSPDNSPKVDPNVLSRSVVIATLVSKNARLIVVPRNAAKKPKIWAIHSLEMHDVGAADPMPFKATLTNGVPPGEIVTHGTFGPWDAGEPGHTPLGGDFSFVDADLSVFEGIRGTLSSRGSFGGSLDHIDVNGETDTPDFTIEAGGHPFPLHTKFHSIVDGTNGDTRLERIDAAFLKSTLLASGAVLDGPKGEKGRTVSLDVTMPRARIEDVMTMAVNAPRPPMTGDLQLTTTFLLPPGDTDVADRLRLAGRFALGGALFTSREVQHKIVELSRRGRGRPAATAGPNVASSFRGRFALADGRLDLRQLAFAVPGAQVRLAGHYALKRETLSFKGELLLDAKLSETVESGLKSALLKLADPFFGRRGGGSAIPIKIEGTRSDPQFGIDFGRVFKRGT